MPVRACVFDAYGTLFDVAGAARIAATESGSESGAGAWANRWPQIAQDWRRKQLEYTWIRASAGVHADFWQVTEDALDWALEAAGLDGNAALRDRLLALYRDLPAYPDVGATLAALRGAGLRCAILSNGSPAMLERAVASAGLDGAFEAVISVEEAGVFKPDPRVYALIERRLSRPPAQVAFVSANGWDACAAAGFGLRTIWLNRGGAPVDRLHARPAHVLPDLAPLPDLVRSL
ncbi:MAG: haloacid dehalogenase type II [Rhodobacteraceae bacterium]|nr:haloacid dehalogenase type II [Paracoccaceae bacterium]